MSFFKFTKLEKTSFTKESRLVYVLGKLPGKVWDALEKALDAAAELLDLGIQGINFMMDLPKNIEKYAKEGWAGLGEFYDRATEKYKSPGNINPNLKVYTEYRRDVTYMHPDNWTFDKPRGSAVNHAHQAAIMQQHLYFLNYMIEYKNKEHNNSLKEYKRLLEAIKAYKKKEIERKRELDRLKIRLDIVRAKIAGGHIEDDPTGSGSMALGSDSETLYTLRLEEQDLLSKIAIKGRKTMPVETRGKYKVRTVTFPPGSGKSIKQFYVDNSDKVTIRFDDSLAEMRQLYKDNNLPEIKEIYAEMKSWEKEVKKLAYWRETHLQHARKHNKKAELAKYHKYVKKYLIPREKVIKNRL